MIYENMLAFFQLGAPELIVIGVVGLLVFGSRLPEVGRSLGRGVVEFKKGLKGIQDEIDSTDYDDQGHETRQKSSESTAENPEKQEG